MCGIIGYIGNKPAAPILVNGLKKLEYRGYDSSGIAVLENGKIDCIKSVGKIEQLKKKVDGRKKPPAGTLGIGHTRWATHGVPSDVNSHPHISRDGRFAIVHNGIIENFAELKTSLEKDGFVFKSETDSEAVAHMLQKLYDGDILSTLRRLIKTLVGSYAIGIVFSDAPDTMYAIRKDNPLIVGLGDGENFIASDVTAALDHTHEFVLLENYETAEITRDGVNYYDIDGNPLEKLPYRVNWDAAQAEKEGYPHFMLKEIYAQPKAITDTLRPRIKSGEVVLGELILDKKYVDGLEKIDIVGCGSAYHAGIVGKTFIEKHCRIRVTCELASEYIYGDPITDEKTLTIIISQSGETADTLNALRIAKARGSHTVAIVNVVESSIAREAHDVLYTYAGPEIAVATTKGYTTQVAALYLLGLHIAKIKGTVTDGRYTELVNGLLGLADGISSMLRNTDAIKDFAERYKNRRNVFFIGRGTDYAASLEGALKLKEISYIHAEAYASGELKHGTISLITKSTVTIALVTQRALYHKMESNIKAVKSRKGPVLAVASPANAAIADCADSLLTIPECDDDISPVLTAVVLQLFAYYVADARGCDIDKPRHLAKSVTVE